MSEAQILAGLLRRRRSRRHFSGAEIDSVALERALQAAMRAPSGANAQPWQYVMIERGPVRERIRRMCEQADREFHDRSPQWLRQFFDQHEITPVKQFSGAAPLLVAVFGRRDAPFWLQSVWLSIANFILALEAEGLASLTYTPSLGRDFNQLLGVAPDWSLQALLPVGHGRSDEVLMPRPRLGPGQKVLFVDGAGRQRPYLEKLQFEP